MSKRKPHAAMNRTSTIRPWRIGRVRRPLRMEYLEGRAMLSAVTLFDSPDIGQPAPFENLPVLIAVPESLDIREFAFGSALERLPDTFALAENAADRGADAMGGVVDRFASFGVMRLGDEPPVDVWQALFADVGKIDLSILPETGEWNVVDSFGTDRRWEGVVRAMVDANGAVVLPMIGFSRDVSAMTPGEPGKDVFAGRPEARFSQVVALVPWDSANATGLFDGERPHDADGGGPRVERPVSTADIASAWLQASGVVRSLSDAGSTEGNARSSVILLTLTADSAASAGVGQAASTDGSTNGYSWTVWVVGASDSSTSSETRPSTGSEKSDGLSPLDGGLEGGFVEISLDAKSYLRANTLSAPAPSGLARSAEMSADTSADTFGAMQESIAPKWATDEDAQARESLDVGAATALRAEPEPDREGGNQVAMVVQDAASACESENEEGGLIAIAAEHERSAPERDLPVDPASPPTSGPMMAEAAQSIEIDNGVGVLQTFELAGVSPQQPGDETPPARDAAATGGQHVTANQPAGRAYDETDTLDDLALASRDEDSNKVGTANAQTAAVHQPTYFTANMSTIVIVTLAGAAHEWRRRKRPLDEEQRHDFA